MIGDRLSAITLMLTDVKDGHEFARTHRGIHREVVERFQDQKMLWVSQEKDQKRQSMRTSLRSTTRIAGKICCCCEEGSVRLEAAW